MSDVARVKAAVDAIALISTYVPLRRSGARWIGRCPFHSDRNPSFSVSPEGFFKCFGCGVGGDVIRFVELKEGLGFRQALAKVAEFAGVPLTATADAPRAADKAAEHAAGLALLNAAAVYFGRLLDESSKAADARAALAEREIPENAAKAFGLGYAWGEDGDWTKLVKRKGWSIETSIAVGLTASSRTHDRFRHRLMFPIHDDKGRVVGFGGRRLRENEPAKYINSPDSSWFRKGRLLYAAHLAQPAWRETRTAVLCEGYLDVIRLHLAGVSSAVAPLGTALTEWQAATVAARARTVVLAFDADAAGRKAALAAWALLKPRGADIRWLELPAVEDPDSFARRASAEAVRKAINEAPPFWERWLAEEIRAAASREAKQSAIEAILVRLAEWGNPVEAELLAEEVASAAELPISAVRARLTALRQPKRVEGRRRTERVSTAGRPRGPEAVFARFILHHPEQRFQLAERVAGLDLHPWLGRLLFGGDDPDPSYRQWAADERMAEAHEIDIEALIAQLSDLSRRREIERRLKTLRSRHEDLRAAGRFEEARAVTEDIQRLLREAYG